MQIHLGYCCVSMLHKKLQCSRSSTKTYLEKHTKETCRDYLIDKARKNLNDLNTLLQYNYEEGIYAYRVPEQVLPQIDLDYYEISDLKDELILAGSIANQYGLQLSTHPSQYFVLNSLRTEVVNRTIHSLNFIADTFDAMNLTKTPNLTLHLGMKNGYETTEAAIDEFCNNYQRLCPAARKMLVLENDHVSFTVENCLKVHEQIGIPIVFDNKHYEWNSGNISYEEALAAAVSTWKERTPKLHLASDRDNKRHAHTDFVLLEDYEKMADALNKTNLTEAYVMLECKQKDSAVLELRRQIKESENL